MRSAKTRIFVFLSLVILTAVFSASALTANQTANTETAAPQESGFIASSFNSILSFFGFAEDPKSDDSDDKAASDAKLRSAGGEAPGNDADRSTVPGCDKLPEGVIACYRADNDARDAIGSHDGAWRGGFAYAPGKVGDGSFNFGGSNRIVVENTTDLNPINLTVDGWVNFSRATGSFAVITKGDSVYSLQVRDGSVLFVTRNANGDLETLESSRTVKLGEWVHIAATHDGTTRTIYIDGEVAGTDSQAGLYSGDARELFIGSATETERAISVGVDEVKLFGRALTGEEIKGLAATERPEAPDGAVTFTLGATQSVSETAPGPLNSVNIAFTRTGTTPATTMTITLAGAGIIVPGAGSGCGVGDDYVSNPNPVLVNWPVGATTVSFGVSICDDAVPEGPESFTATITSPGVGNTGGGAQTITILDNDSTVNISSVVGVAPSSAGPNATLENPGFLDYTFTRTGAPNNFDLPVNFSRTGTADDGNDGTTGGDDFGAASTGTCASETYSDGTNSGTLVIPAGLASCTYRMSPNVDSRVEPNETIILTVTAGSYLIGAPGAPALGIGIIQNDDFANVVLDNSPADDVEGNPGATGDLDFDPERGNTVGGNQWETLNIRFEITGPAECGVDYTVAVGPANQVTAFNCISPTVGRGVFQFVGTELDPANVPIVQMVADTRVEPDETVTMTILAFDAPGADLPLVLDNSNTYDIAGFAGADASDNGDIDDDDETITVTMVPATELSEAGPGGFTVTVNRVSDSSGPDADAIGDPLVVSFSLAGTAACGGGDYTVTGAPADPVTYDPGTCTGTISFSGGGDLDGVIFITPINDAAPENHENFTLTVTGGTTAPNIYGLGPVVGPDGAVAGAAAVTGTILNDDLRVNVQIYAPDPSSVNEGSTVPAGDDGGTLIYRFTRVGEVTDETCVNFNISSGGNHATLATDYTFSFGKGGSGTCANSVVDGSPGSHPAQIRIPGGAGAGTASDPSTAPIPPFTADVTGIQANSNTFVVTPTDDDTVEGDETVQVNVLTNLLNPALYNVVAPNIVLGTILNDDGATITVTGGTAGAEGDVVPNNGVNQYFTISRDPNAPVNFDLPINYTTNTGTAEPADFVIEAGSPGAPVACTAVSGTGATIPSGSSSCTVQVNPTEDSAVEPDETVILVLAPGGYVVGAAPGNTATVTIINDDFSVVSVAQQAPIWSDEGDAGAGNTITFNFSRTSFENPPQADSGTPELGDLTVNVAVPAGTAVCGTDYTFVPADNDANTTFTCGAGGTIRFNGTATAQTLVFRTTPELTRESDETITVTVAAGTNANNSNTYSIGTAAATNWINNDDEDVVTTLAAPTTVTEDGATNLVYTITRLGDVGGSNVSTDSTGDAISVDYTLTGAATNGVDYTVDNPSPLAFAGGQLTRTVTIDPTADVIPENNEDVILTVVAGPNGLSRPARGDAAATVSVYNAGNTATGGVGVAAATGILGNDDFWVSVQVSPSNVTEGGPVANADTLVYTFTRIGEMAPADTLCASFSVAGGGNNATPPTFAGADYPTPVFGSNPGGCNVYNPVNPGSSTGVIGIAGGAGNPAAAVNPPFPALVNGVQTNQNTFTVSPTDDLDVEGDEVVSVRVENDTTADGFNYTPSTPSQADGTIIDDDSQRVEVTVDGPVSEGNVGYAATTGGVLTYTFTRTQSTGTDLTFTYSVAGGTVTPASAGDMQAPPNFGNNVASFVGAALTTTVQITANPDNDVEPDEGVTVTVIAGTGYTPLGTPATGIVLNDDNDITCSNAATVTEGGNLAFTCTRASNGAAAALPLSITYAVSGADGAADYAVVDDGDVTPSGAFTGTLDFGANDTSATLTVATVQDAIVEPNETVTVNFNGGAAGGSDSAAGHTVAGRAQGFDITNPVVTGGINNDDNTVSVAVSLSDPSEAGDTVSENGTRELIYTFTRTTAGAAASQDMVANFDLATSTACAQAPCTGGSSAADFALTGATSFNAGAATPNGTVTFTGNGNNTQTVSFTVDPTPDTAVEPNETVVTNVLAGTGYTVGTTPATGNITNDDTSYTLVFAGLAFRSGTGTANDPYVYVDNPNEGNPKAAGDNTVTVARYLVRRNGANSPAGEVSVSTVPGSGTATAGPPNTLCQNNTPATSQDYITDGQTLAFGAAGANEQVTEQLFTVLICRDLFFENTETFGTILSNPTGGFPTPLIGTTGEVAATIVDDDNPPVLTVCDVSVNENAGTVTITVNQSVATNLVTTVAYSTSAGSATANVDYSSTTGTATIPAGSTSTTFTIPIIDDTIDEPNETFNVNFSNAVNATISTSGTCSGTTAVVTIVDNESNTQFAIGDVVQIEGNPSALDPTVASTSVFNFSLVRTGTAQADETVCFSTFNGDIENPIINPNPATAGPNLNSFVNDYTAISNNCVTFTQNGPQKILIPVIVYGDPDFEFDEYFTVRLMTLDGQSEPVGLAGDNVTQIQRFTDRLGLGTIQNDDLVAVFTITQSAKVTEGGTITYTVTRSGATGVTSTVQYATGGGTATSGGSCTGFPVDYDDRSGTLTFSPGETQETFTVTTCNDTWDENQESFNVTLSNPVLATISGSGVITTLINDDDATPVITVSDVAACEADSGTQSFVFTITRTGNSDLTSVVNYTTVNGTAVAPLDYTAKAGSVTFGPGETTKTVEVLVNGDVIFETDESFTLQVTSATNALHLAADGGDPIGLGSIQNVCVGGDPAPSFALGPVTQAEGTSADGSSGPFFVRLTRTGLTEVPGFLTYSTQTISGQATSGSSCGGVNGTVDFIGVSNFAIGGANGFPVGGFTPTTMGGLYGGAQGANFIDLPVQVCQDSVFELNETFNVTLAAVQFANVALGGTPALVTITNDDGLNFVIRNPGPESAEGTNLPAPGTTAFNFSIDRQGPLGTSGNVCVETVNGTATAGTDFTPLASPFCVTFGASTTSMTVPVQVLADSTPELDETFFLRIVSTSIAGATFDPSNRLATILNDDGPIPPSTGIEGDILGANGEVTGDGVVAANDVTAIRLAIVNGTNTFVQGTNPNQWQRADVNLPCGNGAIDAGDVTVIRQLALNMVAGAPFNACGPTAPTAADPAGEANRADVTRVIRGVNVVGTAGSTVTMDFQLVSPAGEENTLAFSLSWDPTKLTYVANSATLGANVPGQSVLSTNTTQLAAGRLGVLIDTVNQYTAGTRQILRVTFQIAAGLTPQSIPVSFVDQPITRFVSGVGGANLTSTTAYEPGNVVLETTAAGVRVSGRVTSASGQGIRNVTVVMTDSAGVRRTATTSSFGIYTFEDVETGASYVIGVDSKRYRFASRVLNVNDSLADVNFVGQE